jgi:NAD(P)-dependent dehydrogenase (short-subunit alcohol dehydrogenase family)
VVSGATAHAFAQAGADVAIADVPEQSVQETARLVEKAGGACSPCSVTSADPRR